jgi:hypothetical protein
MANKNYGWAFPVVFGLGTIVFISLAVWSASNIPENTVFYENCSISEPVLTTGRLFVRFLPPNVTSEVKSFPFVDGNPCWFNGSLVLLYDPATGPLFSIGFCCLFIVILFGMTIYSVTMVKKANYQALPQ